MNAPRVPADLSRLELFAECDEGDLAGLASSLSPVRAGAGEVLARQGEAARWFLLVVGGEAVAVREDADGEREVGGILPGSIVGELSVLRGAARSATVTATSPFTGYCGDADAFSMLLDLPGVAPRVARTARQRLAANTHPVAVELADGTRLLIRPVLPTDRDNIAETQSGLSRESHYRRFFSPPPLSERVIEYLVDLDYVDHFAWSVLAPGEPGTPAVASARYIRERDRADTAEVALSIVDDYQGRGLGTLLTGALAVAAIENGVRHFRARVLADNAPMRAILRRADARWELDEPGVLVTTVDVPSFGQGLSDLSVAEALRATTRDVVVAAELALSTGSEAEER